MTATTARARGAPGRAASSQRITGLLAIDADKGRAHYECYRPGCPKPREEPIRPSAIAPFISGIKARHLAQYHGE
ncbi:hypothetical protein [Streptomyces sp. MUM 16J]|uniref:hypothetical protein n=1 Tax=Streptomyces sp. MUM 16J TaxID=2791988 RepID=UPI001F040B33|nr:hypothetical protein [Streptomyces sp. MUM 16J]MCH0555788.1 hypothetical protein [Streptomyces sp. MUM 16J]